MSIRATNWALKQRTDGPSAQIVLLIIADSANEHGVSVHADPDYIADRTRQSRATVFRRLEEMERAELVVRITRHQEDGRRIYEVRCRMEAEVNYRVKKDRTVVIYDFEDEDCDAEPLREISYGDSEPQDVEGESQIEAEGESQIETESVSPVRFSESHSCDSRIGYPSKSPKEESPQPPKGGGQAIVDQDLERDLAEAQRAYPGPITNLPRLRSVMGAMAPPERQRVLTAMRGYASFIADCERKNKPRAVKDADRWVAGGMWLGFERGGEKTEAAAQIQHVAVDSPEGRAWAMLHKIAGLSSPLVAGGNYRLTRPLDARGLAFAELPEEAQWVFIAETTTNQVGAWREFLRETLEKPLGLLIRDRVWRGREKITQRGFIVPFPWPPRKDGTLSATGPPSAPLMTADDEAVELK